MALICGAGVDCGSGLPASLHGPMPMLGAVILDDVHWSGTSIGAVWNGDVIYVVVRENAVLDPSSDGMVFNPDQIVLPTRSRAFTLDPTTRALTLLQSPQPLAPRGHHAMIGRGCLFDGDTELALESAGLWLYDGEYWTQISVPAEMGTLRDAVGRSATHDVFVTTEHGAYRWRDARWRQFYTNAAGNDLTLGSVDAAGLRLVHLDVAAHAVVTELYDPEALTMVGAVAPATGVDASLTRLSSGLNGTTDDFVFGAHMLGAMNQQLFRFHAGAISAQSMVDGIQLLPALGSQRVLAALPDSQGLPPPVQVLMGPMAGPLWMIEQGAETGPALAHHADGLACAAYRPELSCSNTVYVAPDDGLDRLASISTLAFYNMATAKMYLRFVPLPYTGSVVF